MAIIDILKYPDPRLREVCRPVGAITAEIRKLLDDMTETMYQAPGLGLAAAQIGSPHRLIVVDVGEDEETGQKPRLYQVINPEILEQSGAVETEEGCLSIPDIRDVVKRAARIVLTGLDRDGMKISIEAEGLLAVCFQHEVDHLDGVLFIDHLSKLKRDLIKAKLKKQLVGSDKT